MSGILATNPSPDAVWNYRGFEMHTHYSVCGEMKTEVSWGTLSHCVCVCVCVCVCARACVFLLTAQTDAHIHNSQNQGRPALLMCSPWSLRIFLLNPGDPLPHHLLSFKLRYSLNCIHLYLIPFYCSCNREDVSVKRHLVVTSSWHSAEVQGETRLVRGTLVHTHSPGFNGSFKPHSVCLKRGED